MNNPLLRKGKIRKVFWYCYDKIFEYCHRIIAKLFYTKTPLTKHDICVVSKFEANQFLPPFVNETYEKKLVFVDGIRVYNVVAHSDNWVKTVVYTKNGLGAIPNRQEQTLHGKVEIV